MASNDLTNRFRQHPATGDKGDRWDAVRESCLMLADLIDTIADDSREKSLAITKVEEAMFWANAAIAREAT